MADKGTGGGSTPLAEWVVQIDAKGAEALDTALAMAASKLTTVEAGAKSAIQTLNNLSKVLHGNAPPGASAAPPTGALQPAGAKGGAPIATPVSATSFAPIVAQMVATENTARGVAIALQLGWDKLKGFAGVNLGPIQNQLQTINQAFKTQQITAGQAQQGIAGIMAKVSTDFANRQKEMQAAALQTQATIQKTQLIMAAGYGLVTSKILGFINAGLSGTGYATLFAFQTEWINREIAAIFVPAIDKVLSLLESFRNALGSLSGNQQALIRNLAGATLGFLGMAIVVPRIIQAVELMGVAIRGAFLANPILGLVSAMGAILVSTQEGRSALGELAKSLEPLAASLATVAEAVAPIFASLAGPISIVAEVLAQVLKLLAPIVEFAGPALILGGTFYFIGTAVGTATSSLITMGAAAASTFATATAGALTTTGAINFLTGALVRLKAAFLANPLGWLALGAGVLLSLLSKKPETPETQRSTAPTRAGGFEELERTFFRLEEASNRSDIPRRQLQTQEGILAGVQRILNQIGAPQVNQPLVA